MQRKASTAHARRRITRQTILGLKTRALRRRIWTQSLNRLERGMLDVTVQAVDQVRSRRLEKVLMRILAKLTDALDHWILDAVRKGREKAARASEIARSWGDSEAVEWALDKRFQLALGLGVLTS